MLGSDRSATFTRVSPAKNAAGITCRDPHYRSAKWNLMRVAFAPHTPRVRKNFGNFCSGIGLDTPLTFSGRKG